HDRTKLQRGMSHVKSSLFAPNSPVNGRFINRGTFCSGKVYNLRFLGGSVKRTIAAIAMLAPMLLMTGLVRADELEDAYTKLKSTVEKKDADAVKADAQATFKLA